MYLFWREPSLKKKKKSINNEVLKTGVHAVLNQQMKFYKRKKINKKIPT